jgi:hypothetical protein
MGISIRLQKIERAYLDLGETSENHVGQESWTTEMQQNAIPTSND